MCNKQEKHIHMHPLLSADELNIFILPDDSLVTLQEQQLVQPFADLTPNRLNLGRYPYLGLRWRKLHLIEDEELVAAQFLVHRRGITLQSLRSESLRSE